MSRYVLICWRYPIYTLEVDEIVLKVFPKQSTSMPETKTSPSSLIIRYVDQKQALRKYECKNKNLPRDVERKISEIV